jgi:ubiquinone/menaquinone biosynthesis C-methylase UbiE
MRWRVWRPTIPAMTDFDVWARLGARVYDPILALGERRGMRERRRALLAGAAGRVLELGAGTGLNLPHYPPAVRELVLSEPEPAMRAVLERRVARSRRPARVLDAPAEALPFPDDAFDAVVSTMVLCTVGDVAAAIAETRRVLRPGGRLLFVEHVRAASPRLARWQDRLAGPWAAFAQGCRCNRPTDALLARELRLERVEHGRWRGMPALVHPLVVGEAVAR